MLQYSGIPFPCEPEMPTQQCMGHLATTSDDKPWTTFNEYSSHLDAVCYYLQNELFHERVEGAVHHLQRGVFESIQGMAALQASAQFVDATLRQVTEAQGQLGEGQRQLSDAMQRDFKELGGLALSLGNGLQNVSAEQARLRKQHAATAQQAMRSIEGVREATHSVGLAVGTALEQQKQLLAGQQSAEEGLVRLREAQEAAFKEQDRAVHALGSAAWEYHKQQQAAHHELAGLQDALLNRSRELARKQDGFMGQQRHLLEALSGLSSLHRRLVEDLSVFKRLGFYAMTTALCFLLTATPRTRSARFWLYAGLAATLAAEWGAQGELGARLWAWRTGPLCHQGDAGYALRSGWGASAVAWRALGNLAVHLPGVGGDGWMWPEASKGGEASARPWAHDGSTSHLGYEARPAMGADRTLSTPPAAPPPLGCPPLDPHELDEYCRCCRLVFAGWATVMLLYAVATFRDYAALSYAMLARQQKSLAAVQENLVVLSRTVSSLSQLQQASAPAETNHLLQRAMSGTPSGGMFANAAQGHSMLALEQGGHTGPAPNDPSAAASPPSLEQVHGAYRLSCPNCDWELGKAATHPSSRAVGKRRGSLLRLLLQKLASTLMRGMRRLSHPGPAGGTPTGGSVDADEGRILAGSDSMPGCHSFAGLDDPGSSSDEDYVPESPLSAHMSGDDSCRLPARKSYDLRPRSNLGPLNEVGSPVQGYNPVLAVETADDFGRLVHLSWLYSSRAHDCDGDDSSSIAEDDDACESDHDSDSWLDSVTDEDSCSENNTTHRQ
eukprot:jgi/Mesvir1/7139/Mv16260-RA.1